MFRELRLLNFKPWGKTLWRNGIELAPLTLFLGTNSSGKSSLLQPLTLLHQTLQSRDKGTVLNLGGLPSDPINFGSYASIVHKHDTEATIGIGIKYRYGTRSAGMFEVQYGSDNTGATYVDELKYQDDSDTFQLKRLRTRTFDVKFGGKSLGAKRAYAPERSVLLPPRIYELLGNRKASKLTRMSETLARQLEDLQYLGALRTRPTRTVQWNQQMPTSLGVDGNLTIQALMACVNERHGENSHVITNVSKWLKRLGVADTLRPQRLGQSAHYELFIGSKGEEQNLVDVGFGISQVLPVLTLCFYAPKGSTLIIEEPEIHLHPLAQRNLADLFIEVVKNRKLQVLVETHSEHFFRRLQTYIARGDLGPEMCQMYFVEHPGKRARVRQLDFDRFGHIKNWPAKFFGDSMKEIEDQQKMRFRVLRSRNPRR